MKRSTFVCALLFDAKSGHGFATSHPNLSMFDTRSMQVLKSIDPNVGNAASNTQFSGDGIYADPSDGRIYVGSHPTKELIVLDAKDDIGRCNGLALDAKNKILFAACGQSRSAGQPPQAVMVIMNATSGKIITTLPLAGSSDGAAFNPGNMGGARTLLETKTGH